MLATPTCPYPATHSIYMYMYIYMHVHVLGNELPVLQDSHFTSQPFKQCTIRTRTCIHTGRVLGLRRLGDMPPVYPAPYPSACTGRTQRMESPPAGAHTVPVEHRSRYGHRRREKSNPAHWSLASVMSEYDCTLHSVF